MISQSTITLSKLRFRQKSYDHKATVLVGLNLSGNTLHLIAASCGGVLRHAVHLTTASLIQTVCAQVATTTTGHVNTALMPPHWREHDYL